MNDKAPNAIELGTPDFWRNLAASHSSGTGHACSAEIWSRAAQYYDDLEACEDYRFQMKTIIDTLREKGALSKESTVLDVACGTGAYSVRMAPICREVHALDVSNAMLARLEEKKRELRLDNIKTILADWRSYQPDAQRYDLVLVSMTPLLRDLSNLDKMLDASRCFLALVTWAGIKRNDLLDAVSRDLGLPVPERHRVDMSIPFNYLYSLGFAPDVHFFHGCWERTRAWERQAEHLLWQIEMRRHLTEPEKESVRNAVKNRSVDGYITARTRVRIAFLLVDKKAGDFPC